MVSSLDMGKFLEGVDWERGSGGDNEFHFRHVAFEVLARQPREDVQCATGQAEQEFNREIRARI